MVVLLVIALVIIIGYLIITLRQVNNISEQLEYRNENDSHQFIYLNILNKPFTRLSKAINQTLKANETTRIKQLNEEKMFREMIINISHDLRTPLTAIKGYQQLVEKGTLSNQQQSQLNIAKKYTLELETLVDKFFEYAYLLNDEHQMEFIKIDVTQFVVEKIVSMAALFEERGLTIDIDEAYSVFGVVDEVMMSRVLDNIFKNCIRYAKDYVKITIDETDKCEIYISNPIDKNQSLDATQIFERFYTADVSRSRSMGLGLAIVKELMEKMEGSVVASLKADILSIKISLPISLKECSADNNILNN